MLTFQVYRCTVCLYQSGCVCVCEREVSLSLCWLCNNIAEQRISISHETKDLIHVAWNTPAAVLNIHIVVKRWMVALLLPWDCNLKNCLLGKDELDVVLGWWCSLCEFPQLGVAALSIGVFPVMLFCVETLWLTFCIDLVGFRRASWTRIVQMPSLLLSVWADVFLSVQVLGPAYTQQV